MNHFTDRLLQLATVLVLCALALRWAWGEVKPLAPALVAGASVWGLVRWLRGRHRF